VGHACPHAPQFVLLVCVSMQDMRPETVQMCRGEAHVIEHVPPLQN
jgi:hypothetical protein